MKRYEVKAILVSRGYKINEFKKLIPNLSKKISGLNKFSLKDALFLSKACDKPIEEMFQSELEEVEKNLSQRLHLRN